MPYRPWCPKCGGSLVIEETESAPVVSCRCGFRLVDQNHIKNFVMVQEREYEEREVLRQAQAKVREEEARKRILEAQEAEREAQEAEREEALREIERKRVAAEKRRQQRVAKKAREQEKITELPQPSAAQRKQGYTTPVYCSECGALIWRRKCEVKQREHFFCSRGHLSAWRKRNPQGVVQSQARNTG